MGRSILLTGDSLCFGVERYGFGSSGAAAETGGGGVEPADAFSSFVIAWLSNFTSYGSCEIMKGR